MSSSGIIISGPADVEALRAKIAGLRDEVKNLSMSYHELREVETILNRTLEMLSRATGSEDLRKAIDLFQKAILMLRSLQLAMHAVEVASGPIGWALAITSIGMAAFNAYDTIRGL